MVDSKNATSGLMEYKQKKPVDFSTGFFAGWTGLEPAASGVTGRRYNQLNYHPNFQR
jgi:hypothetical protein